MADIILLLPDFQSCDVFEKYDNYCLGGFFLFLQCFFEWMSPPRSNPYIWPSCLLHSDLILLHNSTTPGMCPTQTAPFLTHSSFHHIASLISRQHLAANHVCLKFLEWQTRRAGTPKGKGRFRVAHPSLPSFSLPSWIPLLLLLPLRHSTSLMWITLLHLQKGHEQGSWISRADSRAGGREGESPKWNRVTQAVSTTRPKMPSLNIISLHVPNSLPSSSFAYCCPIQHRKVLKRW